MQFGEWGLGGQEMVTSGGERKKCRARTHDRTPPLRNGFQTFSSAHPGGRQSGGGAMGWGGDQVHVLEGDQVCVLEGDLGTEATPAGCRPRAEPTATTAVCVELPPWSEQWRAPPPQEEHQGASGAL